MKKIFWITGMFLTVNLLHAQPSANAELKSLINQSFNYFPKIKEVENTVNIAENRIALANTKYTAIDGNASYEFVKPKITMPFPINGVTEQFQFAPVHNVNVNLSGDYTLFDFGKLKANVDKAKTDLKYAQHNVSYSKSELAFEVANIYYNIVYFQKGIAIEDSVINYLNENKKIIQSKLNNGDALKIDLLNVQASIDAEDNRKVDLQNALKKEFTMLAYASGSENTQGNSFDFDVPLKDTGTSLSDAQQNNLEYALAKDRIQQANDELKSVKVSQRPTIGVNALAGVKNGYVPNVNTQKFNYAAGVGVLVPIYDGSRQRKQIKVAESNIQQNQLALTSLDNEYRKNIQQAYTDITSNNERIQNTAGQIEEAKAAEQLATSRYQNGVGTNLEITNASTNVQRAEFTRLQYQYQLCIAKLQLARLLGYQYW